jgi:hypothetical protein
VGLERGSLSLVSTIEELLGRKRSTRKVMRVQCSWHAEVSDSTVSHVSLVLLWDGDSSGIQEKVHPPLEAGPGRESHVRGRNYLYSRDSAVGGSKDKKGGSSCSY